MTSEEMEKAFRTSSWWRMPVVAWLVEVDRKPFGKRNQKRLLAYTAPILGPTGIDMLEGETSVFDHDEDSPIQYVVPAQPRTSQIEAYVAVTDSDGDNEVIGYEHGSVEPDSHWDKRLQDVEMEMRARHLARKIKDLEG